MRIALFGPFPQCYRMPLFVYEHMNINEQYANISNPTLKGNFHRVLSDWGIKQSTHFLGISGFFLDIV